MLRTQSAGLKDQESDMAIVLIIAFVIILIAALSAGIRAVSRRQQVEINDPAAGAAQRSSQANTAANGYIGRGGGVGGGNQGH